MAARRRDRSPDSIIAQRDAPMLSQAKSPEEKIEGLPQSDESSERQPTARERAATWMVRAVVALTCLAPVATPALADAVVARAWARALRCPLVNHCLFEAALATWGFFQAIAFYQFLDSTEAARRWRFDRSAPVPYATSSDSRRGGLEAGLYLGGVALYHAFKAKAPPAAAPPTAARLLGELAAGIFCYDLLFYGIHRAFHARRAPAWLRRLHAEHHRREDGGALRARETTHHSLVDGFLQVLCNVLVQRRSLPLFSGAPKHDLSRCLHNVVVTYMLVEIHSGYDAPWCMHNVAPGLFGGAKAHEHHHKHGTACFHEFLRWIDVLLGSALPP